MYNLQDNAAGYIKQTVIGNITTIYYCYPLHAGVTLDVPKWKIARQTIEADNTGVVKSISVQYPAGVTSYEFIPSRMETYEYKYANS